MKKLSFRTGFCVLSLTGWISITSIPAFALPQFSLLTGTRCSACHYDPSGSGIRTELGWSMMNEVGLFQWPGSAKSDTASVSPTNTLFNGLLVPGFDGRLQQVRLSTTGQSLWIPMQLATSLAVVPSHQLSIYTDINWASVYERIREKQNPGNGGSSLYPGETDYDLAVQFQPDITLPSIRVGMIEPSFGIRYDDHTAFVNRDISQTGIYIWPPYYNDMGGEITYEGIRWLTINAGLFNAANMSQFEPSIGHITSQFSFAQPTKSARIVLWPQLLDQGLNFELGASYLENGAFKMYDGFAGVGLADKASFSVEGVHATNAYNHIIRNFTVMGALHLAQWLTADWRYDWGQTEDYPGKSLTYAEAFTFGFEFFILPYVELRPEYRIYQSQPFYGQGYYSAQYTGQLHVFY